MLKTIDVLAAIIAVICILNLSGLYSSKLASFLAFLDTLQLAAG